MKTDRDIERIRRYKRQQVQEVLRKIQIGMLFMLFGSFFVYVNSVRIVKFYSLTITLVLAVILAIFALQGAFYYLRPISSRKIGTTGVVTLSILAFIVFSMVFAIDMIKDFPYAISSNYYNVVGTCTNIHTTTGKAKELKFIVNGIEFGTDLKYRDKILTGKTYKVVFLPNSKFVIDIYSIDK